MICHLHGVNYCDLKVATDIKVPQRKARIGGLVAKEGEIRHKHVQFLNTKNSLTVGETKYKRKHGEKCDVNAVIL